MTRPPMELALALLALALGATGVGRARGERVTEAPVPVPPSTTRSATDVSHTVLERARDYVIDNNPFRINRSPGASAGEAVSPNASSTPVVVAPSRPSLVVRAIVGGPPWSALVEGLPNVQGGQVVRDGDAFGELKIREITRDTVCASIRDSTWKFGVKGEQ